MGPITVKLKLTEAQMRKLAKAHKNGTEVTLRLDKNMIGANAIPLVLTANEYKKIQNGNPHDITISATRVKSGGFLPALIAALPTIAGVIGGISGLTGIASNIKSMVKGKGIITDHIPNIPVITPLLKTVGLGQRGKRRRAGGISIAPN